MKLRFTAQATQDLVEIAEYVRAESPSAAERVRASILESLSIIAEFPGTGDGRRSRVFGSTSRENTVSWSIIWLTPARGRTQFWRFVIPHVTVSSPIADATEFRPGFVPAYDFPSPNEGRGLRGGGFRPQKTEVRNQNLCV